MLYFSRKRLTLASLTLTLGGLISTQAQTPATPSANPVAQSSQVAVLDEVVVTSVKEEPTFYAPESFGGTRLTLPIREVPQSIQVVNKQLLQDINAVRVKDSFNYVSSVSQQNAFGGLWENYAVRGFTGDANAGLAYLLNGFPANRGFNPPRDTANVERIEVLKGPTAALYGAGDPGGTINVVTEKPLWVWQHQVEALVGSNDFFRQTIDTTGPLSENVAYRLNLANEDANSFRDDIGNKRFFVAPAFTLKIGDSTTIEYNGEYLNQEVDFDRGVFAINKGTTRNPNYVLGTVPRNRFFGEPNDDPIESENYLNQLRLTHLLNEEWFVRLGVLSKFNSLYGYASEIRDIVANGTQMRRRYRFRDYDSKDWTVQAEVGGKFQTYSLEHEILFGLEAYWFETDQILLSGNYARNLNIAKPVYGQPKPRLTTTIWDRTETQKNIGLYIQDQIAWENWRLLVGLRYDNYDQKMDDRANRFVSKQDQSAFTPRIGLTWLTTETISLYTTYSQSFRPNQGTDAQLNAFDPEKGRAFDIGAKYQSKDGRLGATVAWFNITKENILRLDPRDALGVYYIDGGEAESQGVEFDVTGVIVEGLRASASFTYQDAFLVKGDPLIVNNTLLNIPRVMGSLLLVKEFEVDGAGTFGIGSGLVYVGERTGAEAVAFDLPDYTTVKALAYWEPTKNVRVSLDVDNLFDETYYPASVNERIVQPGTPRTFTAGIQLTF